MDVTKSIDGRTDMVRGSVQTARQTLRASKAKILMVNPDVKLNSRYVPTTYFLFAHLFQVIPKAMRIFCKLVFQNNLKRCNEKP